MATIKKYNGSSWENAVVRKFGTATEAVENPLYSDGTAITSYTIKGNEEHTGTPSPSNPVMPQGTGNKTANLLDFEALKTAGSGVINSVTFPNLLELTLKPNTTYTCVSDGTGSESGEATDNRSIYFNNTTSASAVFANHSYSSTTDAQGKIKIGFFSDRNNASQYLNGTAHVWIVEGSTAKPYEPWGYKIPISLGGVTTNIYLSNPLYKIGDYADEYNAETSQYSRIIDEYVLTGEETVEMMGGRAPIRISGIYFKRPAYTDTLWLCTHYQAVPNSASWGLYDYCLTVSTNDTPDKYMRIRDINYNSGTAEDYKAYLAQQYANGTPVKIYVVRLSAVVSQITPISIPTTDGANTITVDTTVQPTEFTATWTGWHDAEVKEKSENLFDKNNTTVENAYLNDNGADFSWLGAADSRSVKIPCNGNTEYTLSVSTNLTVFRIALSNSDNITPTGVICRKVINSAGINQYTFTTAADDKWIIFQGAAALLDTWFNSLMLNTGSTALPYEPYWK